MNRGVWPPTVGLMTVLLLVACTSEASNSPRLVPTTPASPSPVPIPQTAIADMTFTAPDGAFEVMLASSLWEEGRGDDPTALYLVRRNAMHIATTELSIRMAGADGRVRMCDQQVRTWPGATVERCGLTKATSVEELMDATLVSSWWVPSTEPTTLDGESAESAAFRGYEYPAHGGQSVVYVVAMHGARPVVLRFWTGGETRVPPGVHDVLAGFRFAD
jgi:hypothetical protein